MHFDFSKLIVTFAVTFQLLHDMKHINRLIWAAAVLFAFALQACEKEVTTAPYAETLEAYYVESTHLNVATTDSINRYVDKVNVLITEWPEVKDKMQYQRIVENIRQSLLTFHITINGEWDGFIEIKNE